MAVAVEPSTRGLLLPLFWWIFGYVVIAEIFRFDWELPERVFVGSVVGYLSIAGRYRRKDWREAAAPEQVLGVGIAGLIVYGFVSVSVAMGSPERSWPIFLLGVVLLLAAPGYLTVRSLREVRRRIAADS